jgi:hypothetical protein
VTAPPTRPKRPGRREVYTQEEAVNWLHPLQLLRTGLQAAVATTIGAFADPREVKAALRDKTANAPIALGGENEKDNGIWIDYAADTGDGWNATHSVAWCLCRDARFRDQLLPRPQALVLGGDQVYPTPAQGGYRTRFVDPFRSAFPADVPANPNQNEVLATDKNAPLIVATPGNHDWYDGLRGFSEVFCSQEPIGAWRTEQCASYFVLKLPHGWWIWGLDLQLESQIDPPQLDYFRARHAELKPGDRVVLCAPEPSWIEESERIARAQIQDAEIEVQAPRFRSLKKIEELLGPHLELVLAGDLHHYAHYQPTVPDIPQRITCGGGGAYLLGTHMLKKELKFSVANQSQTYVQQEIYPDDKLSKSLRNRAWRLPTRNFAFCGLLAGLYLMFVWMLQSASKMAARSRDELSLMEKLSDMAPCWAGIRQAAEWVWAVAAHSPSSSLFAVAIVAGTGVFSSHGAKRMRNGAFALGALHGVLHLVLAIALLWALGWLNLQAPRHFGFTPDPDHWLQVLAFIAETLLLGGTLGGLLFGIWIVAANAAFRLHGEEVFSSQRIDDHRCFLRMHFGADGLAVYPMKIEKICRRWKLGALIDLERRKGASWQVWAKPGSGPRFVPDDENEPMAEALADPIFIPPRTGGRP